MISWQVWILLAAALVTCVLSYIGFRLLSANARESRDGISEIAKQQEIYAEEAAEFETAPWMGSTGLPQADERQLARYLRIELGEPYYSEGSLRAEDLRYVGSFKEDGWRVHYWEIPARFPKPTYAYIERSHSGETWTGWGDREPPDSESRPTSSAEI